MLVNPADVPLFERRGATCSGDHVTTMDEATAAVEGSVKWDGCANLDLGEPMVHFCGADGIGQFAELLKVIHRRCGEIMQARGINTLDDCFERRAVAEDVAPKQHLATAARHVPQK